MHKLGIFELLDALSAIVDGESPDRQDAAPAAEERDESRASASPPPAYDGFGESEKGTGNPETEKGDRVRDDAAALEAFYRRHEEISNRAKKNQ